MSTSSVARERVLPHTSPLPQPEQMDRISRTIDIQIMMNIFSTNIEGIRDIHPSVQGSASETELRNVLVQNMLHEVNGYAVKFPELRHHPYTAVVEVRRGRVVGFYAANTVLLLPNMGSPQEFLEKFGKPEESYLFVDMSKPTSAVDLPFFELSQVPARPAQDDIAGQPAGYRRRMLKKTRPDQPATETQPHIVRPVLGAYQEMPPDIVIGEEDLAQLPVWEVPPSARWIGSPRQRDDLDLYIPSTVNTRMRRHLIREGSRHETAGALVGSECVTPDGRPAIRIVDYIAFPQETLQTARTSVTITTEAWSHAWKKIDAMTSDMPLGIVGWAHSHPGFGLFLSADDDFINRYFFSGRNKMGIVFDPSLGMDSAMAPFSRHGKAEPDDYALDSVTFGDGMRFHKGYYLYDLEEEERVQRSIDQIVVSDAAPADQPEVTVLGPTQQVGRPESRAQWPQPETALQYTAEQFYHRLRERYPFSPGSLQLVTPETIPNYPSWDFKDPTKEWSSGDLVLLAENWGVPFALRANGVHFRLILTAPYKKSDGSWAVREYEPTSEYPSEREHVLPNWPEDWRSMTQAQLRAQFKNRHQTELSSSTARAMLQGNYDLRLSLAGINQPGQAQYLKEAQSRMQFDSSNCGPACLYSAMLRSLSIDRPFTSGFRTMGQFEAEDLLGVTLPQPPWVKRTERPEIVITPSPEPPAVAASVGKFPPRRRGMAVNQAVAAQDNREAPQPISQRPEKLVLTTIDGQVVDTAGFYRAVLVMIRKREGEEVSMTEQLQALGKLTAASRQALGRWLEQQET